jgi:hypothetical protein
LHVEQIQPCLNAVTALLVLLAAEGELWLILVVVVNEEVLALVRVGEGAGGRRRLQVLRQGRGVYMVVKNHIFKPRLKMIFSP